MTEKEKLRRDVEEFIENLRKEARPKNFCASEPEELHLELTYECNQKCLFCDLPYKRDKKREISFAEIKNFVCKSKCLRKIKRILLSGGEPWLRKDFLKIYAFLKKVFPGISIGILTNFSNSYLILKNLQRMDGNVWLSTSIDGLDEKHDRVRGRKNAFSELLFTYGLLRKKFPHIGISFTFTLFPENYDQILPVYQWAKKNRTSVGFQVMVQKKETKLFCWDREKIEKVDEQVNEIILDIYKQGDLDTSRLPFEVLNFVLIAKYVRDPKRFFPNCPCGTRFAMFDPFGNVYLCPVHKDKIIGNIRREKFDEIWFSQEAKKTREFFNQRVCHCWLCCTSAGMLCG